MGPCALICTPAWKLLGDCGISEHNFLPFFTYLSHSETWCGQVWWIKDKENEKGLELYEEKAMASHSSTLAWRIPWMEEPGRLQSMGSLRVGHDWATSLSLFTFMPWRRKWQPTPVFLPGESQGRGSLVGFRLWGRTEWDTTEVTQQQQNFMNDYLLRRRWNLGDTPSSGRNLVQ